MKKGRGGVETLAGGTGRDKNIDRRLLRPLGVSHQGGVFKQHDVGLHTQGRHFAPTQGHHGSATNRNAGQP